MRERCADARSGSFTPDANGNLVNSSGFFLQGWQLDVTRTAPPELETTQA